MATTLREFMSTFESLVGINEKNGTHKRIIDVYNNHKPLPRGYKVKYTDSWCSTGLSAIAILTNSVDIIGKECGVEQHVKIFKSKGIWNEDGTITPERGDIIVFNWDKKTQPNVGWSDHIGVVEKVSGGKITTIECNISDSIGRRTIAVGDGRIRGYARPKYNPVAPKTPPYEIVTQVIRGKWGNGKERKERLEKAGYDYSEIQKLVNDKLKKG